MGALKQVFRHDVEKHSSVFRAIVVITQLVLYNGEKWFDVNYDDSDDGDDGDVSL